MLAPEIRTMQGWLDDWGEDGQDDGINGHMHGDDEMMGSGSMMTGPGMLGGRAFYRLGVAPDRGFEEMWLRMMIRHHRGAIAMSRDEVRHGEFPDTIDLARHFAENQGAEFDRLRAMLSD
jgi:uncharacterized protein (DUF305 family)